MNIPDKGFPNVAFADVIDPLLGVDELQVHVSVERNQDSLVLHSPLKLYNDRLVNQIDQKGLGVDWNGLVTNLRGKSLPEQMPLFIIMYIILIESKSIKA